jgi:5-methylcytosine-specific restriction endonuclease McrA
MQPHVRNYFKAFGYDESSRIPCELCDSYDSVEIHHVEPRSSFGSTKKEEQDAVTNLIALCRKHHDAAHGSLSRYFKTLFKQIIANR